MTIIQRAPIVAPGFDQAMDEAVIAAFRPDAARLTAERYPNMGQGVPHYAMSPAWYRMRGAMNPWPARHTDECQCFPCQRLRKARDNSENSEIVAVPEPPIPAPRSNLVDMHGNPL